MITRYKVHRAGHKQKEASHQQPAGGAPPGLEYRERMAN